MAGIASARHPEPVHDQLGWRDGVALGIIVSCQLMLILDSSIVNVALPSIRQSLHLSPSGLAWVPSLYTLVFGGLLLAGGRAGDAWGRRRMLVTGVAIFATASLVGGLATAPGWLLAARALQGLGGALAGPNTLALIAARFREGPVRNRALGVFSMAAGLGIALGYLLGGVLTAELSWRWVMFVNVPFGVAVLTLAPLFIAEHERHPSDIDWIGALASTLGMASLSYAFIRVGQAGWEDGWALVGFTTAVITTSGFVIRQARATYPLLPLRLLAHRNRAGGLMIMFLLSVTMTGTIFFLSQLLQDAYGMTPLRAGLAVVPLALTQIASARLAPRLVDRVGAKPTTVAGTVLICCAMTWLSRITPNGGYHSDVLGPMVLFGLGIGLSFMPLNMMIMADVPRSDTGAASGLLQTTQRIGGSVGVAVLVTAFGLASRHPSVHPQAGLSAQQANHVLVQGIAASYTLATVFCVAALLVAVIVIRPVSKSVPRQGIQLGRGR